MMGSRWWCRLMALLRGSEREGSALHRASLWVRSGAQSSWRGFWKQQSALHQDRSLNPISVAGFLSTLSLKKCRVGAGKDLPHQFHSFLCPEPHAPLGSLFTSLLACSDLMPSTWP